MTRRINGSARTVLLLSFLSALVTGVAAQQQQTPSDDELHCMYCIEVIRAEIDLQHHMISAADEAAGSSEEPAMREQWIKTSAELLQGLANLEGVLPASVLHAAANPVTRFPGARLGDPPGRCGLPGIEARGESVRG